DEKGLGTTRRAPSGPSPAPAGRPAVAPRAVVGRQPVARVSPARSTTRARSETAPEPVQLSQGAHDRLVAELDDLTGAKRREVVARIKAARELGDLRENADYTAAREEQSFLE